ncbi:DUF4214 domain-containing protein [Marinobacterium stanieri]|uniref:DUF4214 domain-containing protein n=1 Tax=Marinobacterium stanieri TaxID=49186 RepID=UPI003A94E752
MANYTLQILHAADMEGGGGDLLNAPAFVSIVDYLEDQAENSLFLSSGDLILPGPYMSAAGDSSLRTAIQQANEAMLGLEAGTLSNLREGAGRVDLTLANLLEASAITLGNHEFDQGTNALADLIGTDIRSSELDGVRWLGAQFPYLSANLDFSGDDSLSGLFTDQVLNNTAFTSTIDNLDAAAAAPKIAPATIIEEGGEQIGIVAATTQILESISSTGGVQVDGTDSNDMALLAQQLQVYINELRDQGINKIVLMSHLQQIALEEELAGLLDGVDIIMAGGSNALLADADEALFPGTGQEPYDAYPILTKDASGNDVVLINTDGGWRYVGQLTVEFDEDGNILTNSINDDTSTIYTSTDATAAELWGSEEAAYAEGSKGEIAQDLVDAVAGLVTEKDGITFGSTDVYLQGERAFVRTEETNLGNLTADANLWYARQVDDAVMVSIKNGGGIREPIGTTYAVGSEGDYELRPPQANEEAGKTEGEVSQLDIESSLRFNNDLSILTLTRAQLLAVIEHAVSASDESSTPGQFAQVAGIQYSFDWTQEAGDRIQSAAIVDNNGDVQDVLVVNGELVGDMNASVKIVTLGFMADGGDGYPFGDFLELDETAVDRIDLMDAGMDAGAATEADAGTEQDAFAEYMLSQFADSAFAEADTDKSEDLRIQNLAFKEDEVLANNTDGVVRLYDTLFDRGPDQAGLSFWHGQLQQGGSLEQIAASFMASDEYQQTLGGDTSNEELIEQLYQNALGREAEAAGVEYWTEQLEQGPAVNVILGISESQEHMNVLL